MDGSTRRPEGDGEHIWLRYATQFTMNGRNVTVEMGIPVPLGANADTRERLIREAEEGMEQLSNHIEGRIGQMVQRIQQGHTSKPAAARPAANPAPVSASPTPSTPPAPTPAARPSTPAQPAQQTPPVTPTPIRETAPAAQEREVAVPPSRPSLGASIPGDTGSTLSLPQFIQIIRETLNLTPKQAMDLLKVKSLSGLNYRDALEDLQHVVATEPPDMPAPTPLPQRPREDNAPRNSERANPSPASARPAQGQPAQSTQSTHSTPSNVVPISKKAPFEEITHAVIRETPPDYPAFDEELDDDEITFGDEEPAYPELTQQERETAEEVLNRLKEARGSSTANAVRLKALNNVIGGQISDEQLLQLIQGVWNIPAVNKLKNDQVEALIYWGKSDDFIDETKLVLALLAEDDYARSDR